MRVSKWRSGVIEIVPYSPGKPVEEVERELGIKAIKLASNENPFGPSPVVQKQIKQAVRELSIYPDGSCYRLRQKLAKKLGCDPEQLIVGNGSNELLILLGMAVLNKGDQVLSSEMSFVVYPKVAQVMQADFRTVPMKKYTFDLKALHAAITRKTKLIFIANPNNPTGTALAPADLESFVKKVPEDCLIVLDEAYFEYTDRAFKTASAEWVKRYPNVAVLRTFSKAYGLAGLRLGYGIVSPELMRAIDRVREPFNVNSLAQVAGLAAFEDQAYMKKCVRETKKERKRVAKELEKMGLTVIPSQTNFLFVDLNARKTTLPWSGAAFFEALMKKGVIIRPMPGSFVRITLGLEKENNKMLKNIETLIKS